MPDVDPVVGLARMSRRAELEGETCVDFTVRTAPALPSDSKSMLAAPVGEVVLNEARTSWDRECTQTSALPDDEPVVGCAIM